MMTIRGYVQSLPLLSGKEDAARVAVVTDDGKEFPVLHKGAGVGLLDNINANVEVTGTLGLRSAVGSDEGEEPVQVIVVKSFRLTDGFDDPWYDDDTDD